MRFINELEDTEYEFHGFTHTREIVRGIILNEKDEVCLEYIYDDDGFGHRDYYETPGGGIDKGEDHKEALNRECEEEIGYHIEVLQDLGLVIDNYNLIKRRNHNYYYLARITEKCPMHRLAEEDRRIKKIIFVNIDEAISLYENMQDELVGKIVKNRELPILKIVKTALQKK